MAIRTILTEPNPILRQISKPLDKVEEEQQGMGGYGSGGPTYINLDMNQKSTTAADQAAKQDEKGIASGANRKKYQNPVKPSGNVPQLGITTNKRQSLIPAG